MSFSIAIPVHNDADNLQQLLTRLARFDPVDQVVVVDDGSDTALAADALSAASGFDPARLHLQRHPQAKGPGAARNRALQAVTSEHMMFLDADDLPTSELPDLLQDLAGRSFDFCLFQHHDSRSEQELCWGQMPWDQMLWEAAGVDLGAVSEVTAAAAPLLARTANYPWNKIYRTAFLRDHGIGCTEILVHEDVELHWRCFLNATTILASDRIAVIHDVTPDGARLTNRAGPERLAAFDPLTRLAADVTATPYAAAFAQFATGLIAWIADNLDPAHHAALAAKTRDFLQQSISADLHPQLLQDAPHQMARLNRLIAPD